MNKALTDGIQLMPPAFELGLDVWSSEDGTPGSDTYDGAANAALIAADADFGGALELLKTSNTQKLRYTGDTPMFPGCYWQIRARVKAISGPLPSVRVAAWAADSNGNHVTGLDETGPSVALQNYGEVVEVSAIVGSGSRGGVDMVWGQEPVFGHFGIDLTGVNNGIVRIDDIIIEDVTSIFTQSKLDVVDVTDFGAIGDGTTNNVAAFEAADAAADGRTVLVPKGEYLLNSTVTMVSEIRFYGTVTMPANAQLQLLQNFDYPTYFTAFGNEQTALEKAIQALFNFTDHESLDLMGRSVELTSPVDVHAVVGNKDRHSARRVIRNGRLSANSSSAWDTEEVTRTASYVASDPYKLTNVANASGVLPGSLVQGAGFGREVYVRSVNASSGELTLSLPLYAAPSNQTYTFTRFKYLLDFSGFEWLSRFTLENLDFACNGRASGVMLADDGLIFHVKDSYFSGPKDRGLTSAGEACAGILLDRNQWLSNEQDLPSVQRTSIGFNVNCNDAKVRNNRAIRFHHWCVISGGGAIVSGNHFFQDDSTGGNIRTQGMIIARNHPKITIIGNYIDNCSLEWTNEHDPTPDIVTGFSFGAMTLTGNHFTASEAVEWFHWISIKPHGTGHFLNGVVITGNVFKAFDGPELQRVESVDDSIAPLLPEKYRNVTVDGNTFNGVADTFMNPVTLEVDKTSLATGWRTGIGAFLPFEGLARFGTAIVPNGPIRNSANQIVYTQPYFTGETGPTGKSFDIDWSQAVRGKVRATVRCDDTK